MQILNFILTMLLTSCFFVIAVLYYKIKILENTNNILRRYISPYYSHNNTSRQISEDRLTLLPETFTTEEAIKITNFKGNMQQWLKRESQKGTLIQLDTYKWQKNHSSESVLIDFFQH